MTEKRTINCSTRYTESFKRGVIEYYLANDLTKQGVLRKFGIKFQSFLLHWMKVYGYEDIHKEKSYIRDLNQEELKNKFSKSKKDNSRNSEEQEDYIKQLERKLEDEKLRSEAYKSMIEIAEKELKISIRKKPNTK